MQLGAARSQRSGFELRLLGLPLQRAQRLAGLGYLALDGPRCFIEIGMPRRVGQLLIQLLESDWLLP